MFRVTVDPVTVPAVTGFRGGVHVVRPGETLRQIAMKYYHNPLEALALARRNGLSPNSTLQPGQRLTL